MQRPDYLPPQKPSPIKPVYHGPDVVRLDRVAPTRVKWLWNQRLALGKLTLIAGDPGLGKSYLTLDLASRVSTGKAMPGDAWDDGRPMDRRPGKAILLSAEDDPGDTVRPRLEAAGARLENVAMLNGVRTGDAVKSFNLREHLNFLSDLCKAQPDTRLVVIDPISAYLGDEEGHSNTKVRNMLAPLAKLAQQFGVAVVAVTHLNKAGQGNAQSAIYRAMGSLAFTAAARTVHLVTKDPDDPERRLMVPIKNNLGQDRTGYGFTLEQTDRRETHVQWEPQPTDESADALLSRLASPRQSAGEHASKTEHAAAWMQQQLAQGPMPSKQLNQMGKAQGFSERTLTRARAAIDIQVSRQADAWICQLPEQAGEQPTQLAFEVGGG